MLHALLIGINEYQNASIPQLSGCLSDTENVANLLLQYPNALLQNIKALQNSDATKNGIASALQNLAKTLKSDDTFLLYYSGHGARELADQAIWHEKYLNGFVCHDSMIGSTGLLSDKELRYLLQPIALIVKRLVVVTDCCHSGSITRAELFPRILKTELPQRAYGDFLFSDKIAAQDLAQAANIKDFLPQPEHLHLAACEDDKLAYESGGGGQFTLSLLDNLKRRKGDASYAELMTESRAALTLRGQTPLLNAYGKGSDWQTEPFLGESEFNDPNSVLLKYLPNKGWRILSGETSGLLSKQNLKTVELTVFDGKTLVPINLEIENVTQTETQLAPVNLEKLDAAKTYRVFVSGSYPPLRIFLRSIGNTEPKSHLEMSFEDTNRKKIMKAYSVTITQNESESDYILVSEKQVSGGDFFILPTQNQAVPIAAKSRCLDNLWSDVQAIQRFRKVLYFNNPNTKWTSLPVAIGYNILEDDGSESPILYSANNNFIEIRNNTRLKISLRNTVTQPMYVAAIRLSSLFGIDNTLHPSDKLEAANDMRVLQGGAITFTAAPYCKEFGLSADVVNHLFIISTKPIDTSYFQQKDLPAPRKETEKQQTFRDAGRNAKKLNEDDWTTLLVQIVTLVD